MAYLRTATIFLALGALSAPLPLPASAATSGSAVQTLPATNVTGDAATLNGYLNFPPNFAMPVPGQVQYRFAFGFEPSLVTADHTPYSLASNVTAGQMVFAAATNLQAATPYYYHLEVVLPNGAAMMGDVLSFSTFGKQGGVPVAHTLLATPNPDGTVTLAGRIDPMGVMPQYWFEFSFNPRMQFSGSTPFETAGNVSGYVDVSQVVSGLEQDAPYYYRLAVQTPNGTMYGDVKSFTIPRVAPVPPAPPAVVVSAVPRPRRVSVSHPVAVVRPAKKTFYPCAASSTPTSSPALWSNIKNTPRPEGGLASLINAFSSLLASATLSFVLALLLAALFLYYLFVSRRRKPEKIATVGRLHIVD